MQNKGAKPKIRGRKLRSGVSGLGALRQKKRRKTRATCLANTNKHDK